MASEMTGFVYAVTFLLIFSALVVTIPIGLQGYGADASEINDVNPSWQAGFQYNESWVRTDYVYKSILYDQYAYSLGGYYWHSNYYDPYLGFGHYRKIIIVGLWLGGVRTATFYTLGGISRSTSLTYDEIDTDAENGFVQYNMILGNGDGAGALIFYWNTSIYADSETAWDNDALYLVHGLGFGESAPLDIGQLLIQLLTLQVPDIPILLGVVIAAPLYASMLFIAWYIIKETLPFV